MAGWFMSAVAGQQLHGSVSTRNVLDSARFGRLNATPIEDGHRRRAAAAAADEDDDDNQFAASSGCPTTLCIGDPIDGFISPSTRRGQSAHGADCENKLPTRGRSCDQTRLLPCLFSFRLLIGKPPNGPSRRHRRGSHSGDWSRHAREQRSSF